MKNTKKLRVIQGLITASDWDDSGSPTEVKICASGEIDYLVRKNTKGARLLTKIREFVTVEGTVTEIGAHRVIDIKSILNSKARSS